MEKRSYLRTIILLIGLCLWCVYVLQEELAKYGIYTLVSYSAHEIMSLIPLICGSITVVWLVAIVVRGVRHQTVQAELPFCALLLALLLAQGAWWKGVSQVTSTTLVATVEQISTERGQVFIQTEKYEALLDCPDLVRGLLEPGKMYYINYHWKETPTIGTLYWVQPFA